jgi:hypothetical protein
MRAQKVLRTAKIAKTAQVWKEHSQKQVCPATGFLQRK